MMNSLKQGTPSTICGHVNPPVIIQAVDWTDAPYLFSKDQLKELGNDLFIKDGVQDVKHSEHIPVNYGDK